MAQLTWQNVNAPDFQGTADSYKTFADLFSNSMNDLNKGVTAFREDQLRSNDNAAIQDALRYQDPGKLREALSNGALLGGPDNRRDISTDALGKIAGLSRTLAEQDELQFRNQETAFDFRQKEQNTAASNATRAINAQLLAANGNPALVQKIIQDNMDVIGRAPTTVQNSLLTNAQSANSTGLTNRKAAFEQGNAEQGFADNQVGQSTAQDIDAKFGDAAAAKAELYRRRESMSPTEWASTGAHLSKIYGVQMIGGVDGTNPGGMAVGIGDATGAIAAAAAAGTGTGSPAPVAADATGTFAISPGAAGFGTNKGSAYDITVGGIATPKPLTQMTMGEVQKFGSDVLIPGNRGMYGNKPDEGSSAAGAWQINNTTRKEFGRKVFGEDWESVPYTAPNQDKLGKAIFEASKKGDLSLRWSALKKVPGGSEIGKYANMSWEDFRRVIGPGEAGGDPGSAAAAAAPEFDPVAARKQTDMLIAAAQARTNKNNIDALPPLLAAAEKKGPGTRESVATELAQHPGFSGMPKGWVANRIDEIMKMSPGKISASVAGALLVAGKQGGPEGAWNKAGRVIADWTFGDANQMVTSDGGQLNMDLITSEAKKYVPGASAEAMVQQNRDVVTLQKLESAKAAYVAAVDKRKAFEIAIANGRNLDPRALGGMRAQEKLAAVEYEKYTKEAMAIIREDFNPAAGRADGTKSASEQRIEKDRKEIDKRLEEIDKQSAGLSRFSMEHTALMAEARRLRAKRSKLSTARKE